MALHTCTGAECRHCYPDLARLHTPTRFRDSRGYAVQQSPECVRVGTNVIIFAFDHWQEGPPWTVLVHRRSDNGFWAFPGGGMEPGESAQQCAIREVKEETGLDIYLHGLAWVDSDPYAYAINVYHDRVVQHCCLTFLAQWMHGDLALSRESLELRWCSTDALPRPFLIGHQMRLEQAMHHYTALLPVR